MKTNEMKQYGAVIMKDAYHVAMKALFPVLGGLSHDVKETIEDKLGKEVFNNKNATIANEIAHIAIDMGASVSLGYSMQKDLVGITTGCTLGMIVVIADVYSRHSLWGKNKNPGSWIGELVSLPIKYLKSVNNRVKEKTKEYKA